MHAKQGIIFAQLWHQGRTTHSAVAGTTPESSSASKLDGQISWSGFAARPLETPKEMTLDDIEGTQSDFVNAAIMAREAGFDGIEIHAGNGYLFDQFHHSNSTHMSDGWGADMQSIAEQTPMAGPSRPGAGSPSRRWTSCVTRSVQDVARFDSVRSASSMEQMARIGCSNGCISVLSYRRGNWPTCKRHLHSLSFTCLSCSHLIEPRFDEFKSAAEKEALLGEMSFQNVSLAPFREVLGSTPLLSAGGFGPDNYEDGIRAGTSDLVAFGRYFM